MPTRSDDIAEPASLSGVPSRTGEKQRFCGKVLSVAPEKRDRTMMCGIIADGRLA